MILGLWRNAMPKGRVGAEKGILMGVLVCVDQEAEWQGVGGPRVSLVQTPLWRRHPTSPTWGHAPAPSQDLGQAMVRATTMNVPCDYILPQPTKGLTFLHPHPVTNILYQTPCKQCLVTGDW